MLIYFLKQKRWYKLFFRYRCEIKELSSLNVLFEAGPPMYLGFLIHMFLHFVVIEADIIKRSGTRVLNHAVGRYGALDDRIWVKEEQATEVKRSWSLQTVSPFIRAVFARVSKVICAYFGFALLRFVIGLRNSTNQPITSKTKTNRDLLAQVFPRFV